MLDLTKYDSKRYDDDIYNCLHFAVDIYRDITGREMSVYVNDLMTGRTKRKVLKEFDLIDKPIDPCLALMHGKELHGFQLRHIEFLVISLRTLYLFIKNLM